MVLVVREITFANDFDGQRFGSVDALISGASDFVPKLTVFGTLAAINRRRWNGA